MADTPGFRHNKVSSSVANLFSSLPQSGDVSAWELLRGLARLHGEYGGGRLEQVTRDKDPGNTFGRPAAEWAQILDELVNENAVERIDGRLLALGLAWIDEALMKYLHDAGIIQAIADEVGDRFADFIHQQRSESMDLDPSIRPGPFRSFAQTRATTSTPGGGPTTRTVRGRPSLQMLSDAPITDDSQDLLGFGAYADGLAGLIDHPDLDTPFTLGINALWGSGKTSLAKMVENRLRDAPGVRGQPPHIFCHFNAWAHDDAPKLASALAAEVARVANQHRRPWTRILRPVPASLLGPGGRQRRRFGFYLAVLLVLALGLAFFPKAVVAVALKISEDFAALLNAVNPDARSEGTGHQLGRILTVLAAAGVVLKPVLDFVGPAAQAVGDFVKSPKDAAADGRVKDVREQLGRLIRQATRGQRRFVIFVDDLERCEPPRAVDVLETLNQLVAHRGVVTVLMADMLAVATCVEVKYDVLAARYSPSDGASPPVLAASNGDSSKDSTLSSASRLTYGRLYLQKIIQLQFDLPPLRGELLKKLTQNLAHPASPKPERDKQSLSHLFEQLRKVRTGSQVMRQVASAAVVVAILGVIQRSFSVTVAAVIVAFAMFLLGLFTELNRQRNARLLDAAMRLKLEAGDVDVASLFTTDADKDLVRQRAQLIVTDESEFRQQAESAVVEFLQPLPRYAKRALNRLRLVLRIAHARGLMDSDSSMNPTHFGHWVVIVERWPEVAHLLANDPRLEADCRNATTKEALNAAVARAIPGFDAGDDLFKVLKGNPPLANVLQRVVYYE